MKRLLGRRVRRPVRVASILLMMALPGGCRTMPRAQSTATPTELSIESVVAPPIMRIGILAESGRASIGADSGLIVWSRVSGETHLRRTAVQRATFVPVVGARPKALRLLETGETVSEATILPAAPAEILAVESAAYRGVLRVLANDSGSLTVVNVVNLEDYVRGVVPNELSPQAFPELEALKAQAVAARTYALRNRGQYEAKGYDICATPTCQVYRGMSTEHPLSDRAVEETRGLVASYRGELINALYTSTCGGHTEDGANIFEEETGYLRGVVCAPERSAWATLRTSAPAKSTSDEDGLNRHVALLSALGVIEPEVISAGALKGQATEGELRLWTSRVLAALHRKGCESVPPTHLTRRGAFLQHLMSSLCWEERGARMLSPEDQGYLLQV